ncbi:MAG: hypothetical protein VKO64_12150 [Candidatus Sericytochromatia bacterium]|nr:hypothetical protein [Candidatus Sericytochromatia bacterium]
MRAGRTGLRLASLAAGWLVLAGTVPMSAGFASAEPLRQVARAAGAGAPAAEGATADAVEVPPAALEKTQAGRKMRRGAAANAPLASGGVDADAAAPGAVSSAPASGTPAVEVTSVVASAAAADAALSDGASEPEARTLAAGMAEELDTWIRRVEFRLQQAAAIGPSGFESRTPRLVGPGGASLPLVLYQKSGGTWRSFPHQDAGLEGARLEEARAGTVTMPVADGLLIAVPGAQQGVVATVVPWVELGKAVEATPAGTRMVLLDREGESVLHSGLLSRDQTAVFRGLMPSGQTEVKVTGKRFQVAPVGVLPLFLVVQADSLPVGAERGLSLPEPQVLESAPGKGLALMLKERWMLAAPLAIGVVAGAALLLHGRRQRRRHRRRKHGRTQVPDMGAVDYLDALARDDRDPLEGMEVVEPVLADRTREESPASGADEEAPAAVAQRQASVDGRRADAAEVDLQDLDLAVAPPPRPVAEDLRARARGEQPPAAQGVRRGVRPEEVLVTRGELDRVLERGMDRLFQRMLANVEDLERKTHEATETGRTGFKELLARFQDLQEARERDLAEQHARLGRFDQDLAAVELRWRGTDARTTEAELRLREQAEGMARRMANQEAGVEAIGERVEGVGQALRQAADHSRAEFEMLRGELAELRKAMDEARRQLRAEVGDEAAQRRQHVDDVREEDRAGRREVERVIQQLGVRLEEVSTQAAGRIDQLGRELDGVGQQILQAEIHQRESLRQVHDRLVPQGQLGQMRQEVTDLKTQLAQRDREVEELRARLDQMVRDQREDRQQLLQQVQRELNHVHQATPMMEQQQIQFITLQQENQRLAQRVQQVLQLMQSLNQTVHQSESRTMQEIDWLKGQARGIMDGRTVQAPPAAPVPQQQLQQQPPLTPPPPPGEERPIDLWGRLMGRDRDSAEDTLRKRRPGS